MGACHPISHRETEPVEDTCDEQTEATDTKSRLSLSPEDKSFLDVMLRKLHASHRFKHLNETIKHMIANDLSVKSRFMRSYFDITFSSQMQLRIVVSEKIHRPHRDKRSASDGMYHTGLVIGQKLITWNDDSLCIPVPHDESSTILSHVLYEFADETELYECLYIIAEKILEWNVCKTYSRTTQNCQHFIDEVCNSLEEEEHSFGHIAEFVNRIRTTGSSYPVFYIGDELSKHLEIRKGRVEFLSHAELDEFIATIIDRLGENSKVISKLEHQLLAKYDRAFWNRHKIDGHESSAPHNCYFEDWHSIAGISKSFTPTAM
jgi:hypothetical protein